MIVGAPAGHARAMDPTHDRTAVTARLAVGLASLSAAGWAAKAVAIGTAGGLDLSPAEGPLFFLGLGANVAAVACLLLVLARHRPRGQRVLVALSALPLVFALGLVTRGVVWLFEPPDPHWVWAELNLWVVAVALLCVAVVVHRRVVRHRTGEGAGHGTRRPTTVSSQGVGGGSTVRRSVPRAG